MRRPTIGVTSSRRGGRFLWWFSRLAVWRAGGRAVRLVVHKRCDVNAFDGLILGGGEDIGADVYGGSLVPDIRIDVDRDRFELALLRQATTSGIPVLGICRGAQMINVHFGGTLHTDIQLVYAEAPPMHTPLPRKQIHLLKGSRLHAIVSRERDWVNALHHQAIARLGRGLRVAARDAHGMVQAIEHPTALFLIGVQWHPELLVFDAGQQQLFRAFIQSAVSMSSATTS